MRVTPEKHQRFSLLLGRRFESQQDHCLSRLLSWFYDVCTAILRPPSDFSTIFAGNLAKWHIINVSRNISFVRYSFCLFDLCITSVNVASRPVKRAAIIPLNVPILSLWSVEIQNRFWRNNPVRYLAERLDSHWPIEMQFKIAWRHVETRVTRGLWSHHQASKSLLSRHYVQQGRSGQTAYCSKTRGFLRILFGHLVSIV